MGAPQAKSRGKSGGSEPMTTRSEKLEFEGSQGATLAARIEWPLG